MKKLIILLLIFFLNSAFAQIKKSENDTLIYKYPTEVLITAPRLNMPIKSIPFATSIVDKSYLNNMMKSIGIDEPLKLVPGLKVDNQANGERIHLSIRGQGILSERGIRGIKILQDGIPLNDPSGFAPDVFDMDWATVDRIEVLRGPSASLYGGSSSGGIINILTENGPMKSLGGSALGTFGSNNFWKGLGQFGANVDNVNYRVSFSREMGDGYRQHTHFWANKVYGKATYTTKSTDASFMLTPVFNYIDVYNENPEGINLETYNLDPKLPNSDAIPFNEYLSTNRITTGLTGNLTLAKEHNIDFSAYTKVTAFTEANNHIFNMRHIQTPGASIQYTYNYGKPRDNIKNHFSLGSDMQWQTIDQKQVDNIYSKPGDIVRANETIKQSSLGLFAIDKIDIGPDFNIMASFRYDKIKNEVTDLLKSGGIDLSDKSDFDKATGRIGVSYSPLKNLSLFANWGQGFLPPATEELAQNPAGYGGFNKNLVSATSMGEEIGVRGSYKDYMYYDITGFYLKTENDFDRFRLPSRGQETFYMNSGASNRIGIEFYTKVIPVRELVFQLAYTFSSFKYSLTTPVKIVMDDTTIVKYIEDGKYLPNSPQHQLCLDLQYFVAPGLSLGLSSETFSKSYIDGANFENESVEGYTLFHGRVAYNWRLSGFSGEVSFNIRNIGDKKYVAFSEPDPGGNAYQPGAGREFFGGLKIRF